MPSRLICVALLSYWLVAAFGLVSRDLLPELSVGSPPDLRTIASAGGDSLPAVWSIQVVDHPGEPDSRRTIGQAVTASHRAADGWVEMTSKVTFDSGQLLAGLSKDGILARAFASAGASKDAAPGVDPQLKQIRFQSVYHIDPSGNLRSFEARVYVADEPGAFCRIDGVLKDQRRMEVVSRGAYSILNRTLSFDYTPHGVVQSQFGPLDRLPGLQVGQRWDEQVASPLTGQVETVRAEVTRKALIHWDRSPVRTLEVEHRAKGLSARTFVRPDGLVLRQEMALPLLRLVLERQPDRTTAVNDDRGDMPR